MPRAQQRGSFHAPFLAMAEPKQASLCSFGLTKRLSLFRSVAYLPLLQKLFNVVKVVFVVLKIYSISVCVDRCCTIAPCMRERFHPVYGQGCGKAITTAMRMFAACAACKAKSTQPRASEATPWVKYARRNYALQGQKYS